MVESAILIGVAFLGNKIIEALKYLRAKDWNALVTLLSIHITGAVVMLYAAAASLTEGLVVPGTGVAIGTLDNASVVFLGLTSAAFTSKLYDFQKAVDGSDSAAQPQLTSIANSSAPKYDEHGTG